MHIFFFPILISVAALAALYLWGGIQAFAFGVLLVALEVVLSFDNAVVNAKVLERMSPLWQQRFLTWGVLIAVFGTRFVLPILIVSATVFVSPFVITTLALNDSAAYGQLLYEAGPLIGAFGGAFLLMVSLKYFFDDGKRVHWIRIIEQRLSRWGRVEAVEIALTLIAVVSLSFLVAPAEQSSVLVAGVVGTLLFILMQGIMNISSVGVGEVARGGALSFLYLNILDSSFSLDGVIGAFAITKDVAIIAVGLGVGAYFVRTLTVYLVRQKTLESLIYLEHGAHWAILGLAFSMLFGLIVDIPEAVTGLIGVVFVALAYFSSVVERDRVVHSG